MNIGPIEKIQALLEAVFFKEDFWKEELEMFLDNDDPNEQRENEIKTHIAKCGELFELIKEII
jgi:hypothetical protein